MAALSAPASRDVLADSLDATADEAARDLDPPYLYAWCHLRGAERVFTLSRIHTVMPPA
ncbi:WYL domain-containing protein [Streptomyces massasporeus]